MIHDLGEPHVRHLEGKLWELRLTGRDGIARALYVTAIGRTKFPRDLRRSADGYHGSLHVRDRRLGRRA
ncbi:MAG: type II toxin-antitoxin system RelE/ParE family toxin [Methylobacteriaceae bacterium]|nr:type II toxin-antitoxin system RelE/ParE family toxin [Methylobacteriaceae bacterium]